MLREIERLTRQTLTVAGGDAGPPAPRRPRPPQPRAAPRRPAGQPTAAAFAHRGRNSAAVKNQVATAVAMVRARERAASVRASRAR